MSSFLNEETRQRFNQFRDAQTRTNAGFEERMRQLETENVNLRNRIGVLTRILIAKQIASAEEIANALTESIKPAVSAEPPVNDAH